MSYTLHIKVHEPTQTKFYVKAIAEFENGKNDNSRDSGFDLYICDEFNATEFSNKAPFKVDHNVSCAVYKDGKPSGYYLYPRSSISKTPFRLANSVGIIDSGYRGNLIAKIDKVYDMSYNVYKGDRLFQICTPDLTPFDDIRIVDELDDTKRGTDGFGSTGN